MKYNTVQEGLDSYLKSVTPKNAGQAQIEETKNVFYAGAFWVCHIMMAIAGKNVSEDAGAMIFDGLIKECERHANNNVKGE